jgi:hypothetical protein
MEIKIEEVQVIPPSKRELTPEAKQIFAAIETIGVGQIIKVEVEHKNLVASLAGKVGTALRLIKKLKPEKKYKKCARGTAIFIRRDA